MKNGLIILLEATKIAVIALVLSYIFFTGLVKADGMYDQTHSDAWGVMIIAIVWAVADSIIMISGVYFFICRKKRKIISLKITSMLMLANVVYVGLMFIVFPLLYNIHESNLSGSEWGSDLLLVILQGCVLLVSGIWMLILGVIWLYKRFNNNG